MWNEYKAIQLYNEEGLLLGTEESEKELVNHCKTVYSRHENFIEKSGIMRRKENIGRV